MKQLILDGVATGSDSIEMTAVIHAELACVCGGLVSINHPEHPDYDAWLALTGWCDDYRLSVSLRQNTRVWDAKCVLTALPRMPSPLDETPAMMLSVVS